MWSLNLVCRKLQKVDLLGNLFNFIFQNFFRLFDYYKHCRTYGLKYSLVNYSEICNLDATCSLPCLFSLLLCSLCSLHTSILQLWYHKWRNNESGQSETFLKGTCYSKLLAPFYAQVEIIQTKKRLLYYPYTCMLQ